jgi:hypothetical protein
MPPSWCRRFRICRQSESLRRASDTLPTKPGKVSRARPLGPVDVTLPDGSAWVFRFVKVACNVAHPKGTTENRLDELLKSWFGPDHAPSEVGWMHVVDRRLKPGMFVARIVGHSMVPKIPSGARCLFRERPAGSREGRIVLVQFHSMSDPEGGGRYTLKKISFRQNHNGGGLDTRTNRASPIEPNLSVDSRD